MNSAKRSKPWRFVYENGDWGKGFAASWKELAKKSGMKVVLDEAYPSTATDLSPVVNKIKRAKPDVLMLVSNAADAILLTNTLAEYRVKPQGHHRQRRRSCRSVVPAGRGQERPVHL